MTIDEAKFVQTALELLKDIKVFSGTPFIRGRVQQAIKALEVALGL